MSQLATFTPLLRQTVGFDRFNDLFESMLDETSKSFDAYPPYNIEKTDEDSYLITLAVAGFSEEDLDIIAQDDRLTISAKRRDEDGGKDAVYLHRGIAMRAFERTFRLADHIRVVDASLENGLLVVSLVREVPEEKKPRMIAINKTQSMVGNGSRKSKMIARQNKDD